MRVKNRLCFDTLIQRHTNITWENIYILQLIVFFFQLNFILPLFWVMVIMYDNEFESKEE